MPAGAGAGARSSMRSTLSKPSGAKNCPGLIALCLSTGKYFRPGGWWAERWDFADRDSGRFHPFSKYFGNTLEGQFGSPPEYADSNRYFKQYSQRI